uniref:MHC class II beta chain N-terminal domain-containing protein n=1 Tax=Kryptolebias marmoratus TaxID=37003 RepID=A0A3Q3A0I0_KRYMA
TSGKVFCLKKSLIFTSSEVLVLFCSSDGFEEFSVDRCVFNSSELKDIEYIRSYYYNKKEYIRFSSSVGHYVGYTEHGVKNAERLNNMPGEIDRMMAEKERYCLNNVGIDYPAALTKSVKPTVRLFSTAPSSGRHPAMLVCRFIGYIFGSVCF